MVPLWLRVLLDDLVNQLPNLGLQPDFAALAADQRRYVLKFIKLIAPRLLMGDGFALQGPSAMGAHAWFEHRAIPSFASRDRAIWRHRIDGRLRCRHTCHQRRKRRITARLGRAP